MYVLISEQFKRTVPHIRLIKNYKRLVDRAHLTLELTLSIRISAMLSLKWEITEILTRFEHPIFSDFIRKGEVHATNTHTLGFRTSLFVSYPIWVSSPVRILRTKRSEITVMQLPEKLPECPIRNYARHITFSLRLRLLTYSLQRHNLLFYFHYDNHRWFLYL